MRPALAGAATLLLLARAAAGAPPKPLLAGQVNLNTATALELTLLPGIGPRKALAIVEHRVKRPFRFPEQIVKVRGIGRAMFRRLKPHVVVEGDTTLRIEDGGRASVDTSAGEVHSGSGPPGS